MSRFATDGVLELLTQSFEIAVFRAGAYVEVMAPDLRPAAFLLCLALLGLGALLRRLRKTTTPALEAPWLTRPRVRLVVIAISSWLVAWFVGLAYSGNGRYLLPLLLVVGPLLGVALMFWRVRSDVRWLLLLLLMAIQAGVLYLARPEWQWAFIKTRWEASYPLRGLDKLLSDFKPDAVLTTQALTQTAHWVQVSAVLNVPLVSLSYVGPMSAHTPENQKLVSLLNGVKRPVLLDSFLLDFVPEKDVEKLTWRKRSSELLAVYGWFVKPGSCQRLINEARILHVMCELERGTPGGQVMAQASAVAEARMARVAEYCDRQFRPFGERYVMGDGSLVQVFREGRYVMRTDQEGRIYVKPRGLGNFQVIADPSKDGDALSFSCQDLPRNK